MPALPALPNRLPARHRSTSTPTPGARPLDLPALVGAAGWARLPQAVQRRFGTAHADVVYRGHMDLRCSRIGRLHALAARLFGGPLTCINAADVPTEVRVHDNGCGGVVWERRFHGDGVSLVRSTKELGPDGGLRERTDGGLSMSLDVFEEDGALVFCSRRFWLVLGWLRLPVPAWLTPGVCRVTHTDLGQGLFRFTLTMIHPLWGETFHQTGVFADPAPACEPVCDCESAS